MPVRFVKSKLLTKEEVDVVNKIGSLYLNKIERYVKNPNLIIQIKKQKNNENKAIKYSIRSRIVGTTLIQSSCYDWNLSRAMHSCFKKLLKEIDHKFKVKK
jgi:hypothetical protein